MTNIAIGVFDPSSKLLLIIIPSPSSATGEQQIQHVLPAVTFEKTKSDSKADRCCTRNTAITVSAGPTQQVRSGVNRSVQEHRFRLPMMARATGRRGLESFSLDRRALPPKSTIMMSSLVAFFGLCCLPDHARAVPYFNWLPGGGPRLPVSLGEVASAIVDRKMFVFGQGNFGTFVYVRLPSQPPQLVL